MQREQTGSVQIGVLLRARGCQQSGFHQVAAAPPSG